MDAENVTVYQIGLFAVAASNWGEMSALYKVVAG